MNILFCSVGRRAELIKDFRKSMGQTGKIVVTDFSRLAPAAYVADKYYAVPEIYDSDYIPRVLEICRSEKIDVITTLIDPEIGILADAKKCFQELGITVLAPDKMTAEICLDKYDMYKYLTNNGINTVRTWKSYMDFQVDFYNEKISFPVFVKPRRGSGSVGIQRVDEPGILKTLTYDDSALIIQEYMGDALDMDADVYIDTISHKPVSIFTKRKLETKTGGASKTISFKDDRLFSFIGDITSKFKFSGPVDMDFFYKDGSYYLSEINPRFGGAYLHAYGAGVDFVKMIERNVRGMANPESIGDYEEEIVMMMYDSVEVRKIEDYQYTVS